MDQYEFSEPQNTQISKLAESMNFVGTALIVLGAIGGLSVLAGNIEGAITGAFYIFIGIWTRNAGQAFQAIVNTEGTDIAHLMTAIGNLDKLYSFQKWLIILAIIALAIAFIVGVTTA